MPDSLRRCFGLAERAPALALPEISERPRVVIEQGERTVDGPARHQVAGIVFLKGPRAAADDHAKR